MLDVLLVAARAVVAGRRIILLGPPGTGKTMIALSARGPPLELDDHARRWLDAEYEAMFGADRPDVITPPFRAPHHTCSALAIVGQPNRRDAIDLVFCRCGGTSAHPSHDLPRAVIGRAGEVQPARFGVLMLDELVESLRARVVRTAREARPHGARPRRVSSRRRVGLRVRVERDDRTEDLRVQRRAGRRRGASACETACDSLKIAERVDVPYVDLRLHRQRLPGAAQNDVADPHHDQGREPRR